MAEEDPDTLNLESLKAEEEQAISGNIDSLKALLGSIKESQDDAEKLRIINEATKQAGYIKSL